MFKYPLNHRVKAVSLLEVSISLIIIGSVTLSGMYVFKAINKLYKIQTIKTRQELILSALGRFTSQFGYLPYPATKEDGTAQPAVTTANIGTIQTIGLVPWKTLGLPQHVAYDGDNKPLTYIMHPMLGPRTDVEMIADLEEIFEYTDVSNLSSFCFVNPAFSADTAQGSSSSTNIDKSPDPAQSVDKRKQGFIGLRILDPKEYSSVNLASCFNTYKVRDTYTYNEQRFSLIDAVGQRTNPSTIYHDQEHIYADKLQGRPEIKTERLVCDCIAVVLISGKHDLTNKPFSFEPAYGGYTIDLKQNDKKMVVSYVTRFNLYGYGGPRCRPIIKRKYKMLELLYKDHPPKENPRTFVTQGKHHFVATRFINAVLLTDKHGTPITVEKEPVRRT